MEAVVTKKESSKSVMYFKRFGGSLVTHEEILKEYPNAIFGKYGWGYYKEGTFFAGDFSEEGNNRINKYSNLLDWKHLGDNLLCRSPKKKRDRIYIDIINRSGCVDFLKEPYNIIEVLTDLNYHSIVGALYLMENKEYEEKIVKGFDKKLNESLRRKSIKEKLDKDRLIMERLNSEPLLSILKLYKGKLSSLRKLKKLDRDTWDKLRWRVDRYTEMKHGHYAQSNFTLCFLVQDRDAFRKLLGWVKYDTNSLDELVSLYVHITDPNSEEYYTQCSLVQLIDSILKTLRRERN